MKDILTKCSLFDGWSSSDLDELVGICDEKHLSLGQILFPEGAASTSLFVVKSGSIKIEKSSGDDDEVVAQFGPSAYFGEMGMLSFQEPGPRSASASGTEVSDVIEVPYAALNGLLEKHPQLAGKFYKALAVALATRIRKTTQDLASLKSLRLRHV